MSKFAQHDLLLAHVTASLPDSLAARRDLLNSLLRVLPRTYPRRSGIKLLLHHLDEQDKAQLQLQLELKQP